MKNYLAVDTSGKNLTVIIKYKGKKFSFFNADCGTFHSVKVMPVIEETVIKAGCSLDEMDFFACVIGAGSFTGIRIGVSTVKALAFAYKKKVLPITSFDTVAYNKDKGKYLAVIDAKHNGYYVCGYTDKKVSYPPSFINGDELSKLQSEYSLISFEKIDGFDAIITDIEQGLYNAVEEKQGDITEDINALVPLYIRKSQAEEGR
ncbi:MAG: tRNA (adenosine(37)-N6)-threonylcarbamoyltransferase complex dimerization subunit type 1 TsaB [Clostridia bacterium]|nr:tRNA (adenosine(37)-N6)-threonylcarbamoyltransferase complex dimerization subunit type 1 TsaB [Clostridia bacterium]